MVRRTRADRRRTCLASADVTAHDLRPRLMLCGRCAVQRISEQQQPDSCDRCGAVGPTVYLLLLGVRTGVGGWPCDACRIPAGEEW